MNELSNVLDGEMLAKAVMLSVVIFAVVNYLKEPIKRRFPAHDLWYVIYITFGIGATVSALAGLNLFAWLTENSAIGIGLTAALVGGGSNLIYEVFGRKQTPTA